MLAGGWQEWSAFSDNRIAVGTSAGRGAAVVLDRRFDDTWYLGAAIEKRLGQTGVLSAGVKYDSSPVDDVDRTLDLPFDETWTLSASYAWRKSDRLALSVGGSLLLLGDAPIDQTSQGVRVVGKYDTNYIFFVGGNVRWLF